MAKLVIEIDVDAGDFDPRQWKAREMGEHLVDEIYPEQEYDGMNVGFSFIKANWKDKIR